MVSSLVGVCSFTWTVCPYCLPPQHFGFGLGNSFTFCLGAMVLTRMKPSPEEREKVTSAILKRSRKLKKDQGPEKTQRCLSQPGLQIGRSLTKTHGLINKCGEQVRWWKWTMLCFVYIACFQKVFIELLVELCLCVLLCPVVAICPAGSCSDWRTPGSTPVGVPDLVEQRGLEDGLGRSWVFCWWDGCVLFCTYMLTFALLLFSKGLNVHGIYKNCNGCSNPAEVTQCWARCGFKAVPFEIDLQGEMMDILSPIGFLCFLCNCFVQLCFTRCFVKAPNLFVCCFKCETDHMF